ncbi:uncharacterized protein LOC124496932 isoform X2 [Dermatophagoides farinae]|uniref:uncharacterized protein LOC124496932 isoform X2 n=1 Tax=Dermatophagoides farinae TaxID=6954 RepID=UPI003F5ED697
MSIFNHNNDDNDKMKKKHNGHIHFNLEVDDDDDNDNVVSDDQIDNENNRRHSQDNQKSGWVKKFRFSSLKKNKNKKTIPSEEQNGIIENKTKKNKSNDEIAIKKQKLKLVKYLSTEEPIMKNKIQIDDNERELLATLNPANNIDVNKYFRIPESKINDKLWRIPYGFRNDDDDDDGDYDATELPKINRFGEGVNDGCMIGLNLPKIQSKQRFKTWQQLIECSDEALYQFSHPTTTSGSGRRIYNRQKNRRRGSILQPRPVFLMPNPEMDCLLANNQDKNNKLREWSSELTLDVRHGDCCGEELLDSNFRQNILDNVSIDDLSNMLYPELKLSFNVNGMMTDSEMRYIQAVSNRRRQSLVPPTFSGGDPTAMTFRRQSYGGGQLWSTEVERQQQHECYQDKVALINPEFRHRRQSNRMNSLATQLSIFSDLTITTTTDMDDENSENSTNDNFIEFDPESEEQIILFANELTIIVRKYFNSIKSSEIIHFFLNVTNAMNRIVRLIATYILQHEQLEQRVRSILFFIRVIGHLQILNNWHSVNLITKSLQCPPVVRLKDTWRKITFVHPEDYCNFIEISEDLEAGNQWLAYETAGRFLPIFDDTIAMIKERCGLMIVQIQQYRFHQSWKNHARVDDHDLINWINQEVGDILKDCGGAQQHLDYRDDDKQERPQRKESIDRKKPLAFWHRIFNRRGHGKADGPMGDDDDNRQQDNDEDVLDVDDDVHQTRLLKGSKNELTNVVRRRRTSKSNRKISVGQLANNNGHSQSSTSSIPSCKQFWTWTDFYKLRQSDREMIKQQIVRTMVNIQKKAFYVFEDRDERIRNFLLNSNCDSMDACMRRSQMIENKEQQQQRVVDKTTASHSIDDDQDRSIIENNGNNHQSRLSASITIKINGQNNKNDGLNNENNNNSNEEQHQQQQMNMNDQQQTKNSKKPKRRVMFS